MIFIQNFYIDLLYDPNEGDPTSPIKPVTNDKTDGNDADMYKPKPLPRRKSIRRGSHPSSPASPLPSSPTKAFDSSEVRKLVVSVFTYFLDFFARVSIFLLIKNNKSNYLRAIYSEEELIVSEFPLYMTLTIEFN